MPTLEHGTNKIVTWTYPMAPGTVLQKKGGRIRKKRGFLHTATWTTKGDRCSCAIRFAGFDKNIPHLWNFLGATRSHERTWQLALKQLSSGTENHCFICEDDCQLTTSATRARRILNQTKKFLSTRPWMTLQLGARPCGRVPSKRRVVKKLDHGFLFDHIYCFLLYARRDFNSQKITSQIKWPTSSQNNSLMPSQTVWSTVVQKELIKETVTRYGLNPVFNVVVQVSPSELQREHI
jgi:hypothetical protein